MQDKGAVLISGASTGIGRATALLLDRSGYRVFAGVRKQEDGARLRGSASDRLYPLRLDITDGEQIAAALEQVEASLPAERGLAALVNNAGIAVVGPLEYLSLDELRRQLEVSVVGHVAMTQAFLPLIKKGRGRIINVGSATGRFALPFLGAYSISRFGMEAFTDALRQELRPWGIHVSLITPGTVETQMWNTAPSNAEDALRDMPPAAREDYLDMASAMMDLMNKGRSRALAPDALAQVVRVALESRFPRTRYRRGPGATMAVVGSWFPSSLTDWFIAKIMEKKLPSALIGW
jgi:NAD(P)-dependent dehydrogenase (short-subunit alcohol dehydrogenase family)